MKQQILYNFVFFLLSAWVIPQACAQGNATTFYVAADGQPGNPGTQDKPFQRPEQALEAAGHLQGAANITIYVRGGNYTFSKSLVIPNTAGHLTITGWQNEKVIFSGGQQLDPGQFKLVSDQAILSRLPAAARGKVYVTDLKKAGITDLGKEQAHGYKLIRPAPLELFYNGAPLTVARYPNNGYLPIGKVSDPGANPRQGDHSGRGATFSFDDSRMNNWGQANDAWVGGYFSYGYSDDYLKVAGFDATNKAIHLAQAAMYSVFSTDDVSNEILRNSQKIRGFYVYNLLEEIDEPGEWFLDKTSGLLYCWPPDNINSSTDIEVSLLEGPIVQLSGTQHVSISNINFEYGRGMGMEIAHTQNTTLTHCSFTDLGTVGIYADNLKPSPAYNTNLLIRSCTVSNTGTGGVILSGGDRKTLQPSHNVIDNCEIYNYSRINRTFCPAVSLNGVGNQVTHCYIHDAPDQAIMFYGNDLDISYNRIDKVTWYMTDAGAVGTGRDLGTTGNTIDYNLFENITSDIGSSLCALYLDDGSSGMKVDGNIFYKTGTGGTYHFGAIHINGGTDNTFRNDYFIDCDRAFSNSQWTDQKWKSLVTDSSIARVYRPGVDIRSALFQQKYPHLAKMADSNALTPRQNYTFNILTYNVGVLSSGAGITNKNPYIAHDDPGFADKANADFTLTRTPSQLSQAADWKPVPFREIGIQQQ